MYCVKRMHRALKITLLFGAASVLTSPVSWAAGDAKQVTVSSINELQKAISKSKPGAVITIANGTYKKPCTLSGKGTKAHPIVVQTQTVGSVTFTDRLSINGEHITVKGLKFIEKGVVTINGRGCRLTQSHMDNVQAGQWIIMTLKSRETEVDYSLFENKENNRTIEKGCQLLRAIVLNKKERHHIHHNHFRNIPKGKAGNGYETVQIITRRNPKNPQGGDNGTVIENNLFERCNGESEIISIKSNGNFVRNNTFRACRGGVVLRHGHRNTASGNLFLGDGETGSSGIRLQGRDQVVANNMFIGLGRSAIAMMDGTSDDLYVRVERAAIAYNTVLNCGLAMDIGLNHSKHPVGTVPKDCIVVANVFLAKEKTQAIRFVKDDTPENWTWTDNVVLGDLGIPPAKGISIQDPRIKVDKNGMAHPTVRTPSAKRSDAIQTVSTTDLFGTPRKQLSTVGAIQFPAPSNAAGPLTAKEVGPNAAAVMEPKK